MSTLCAPNTTLTTFIAAFSLKSNMNIKSRYFISCTVFGRHWNEWTSAPGLELLDTRYFHISFFLRTSVRVSWLCFWMALWRVIVLVPKNWAFLCHYLYQKHHYLWVYSSLCWQFCIIHMKEIRTQRVYSHSSVENKSVLGSCSSFRTDFFKLKCHSLV